MEDSDVMSAVIDLLNEAVGCVIADTEMEDGRSGWETIADASQFLYDFHYLMKNDEALHLYRKTCDAVEDLLLREASNEAGILLPYTEFVPDCFQEWQRRQPPFLVMPKIHE